MDQAPSLDVRLDGETPRFVEIARALADEIRRGRLGPGERLPGSRPLARRLGVERKTVIAAYEELVAEGWATTAPRRGTFVAEDLPTPRPRSDQRWRRPTARPAALADRPAYSLPAAVGLVDHSVPEARFHLGGGLPDLRLVPTAELARAYRRVLARRPERALAYGDPRGQLALRRGLAELLKRRRGLAVADDEILICRGAQMGLHLAARALLRPGDTAFVEAWGYAPAWAALRRAGARLVPIEVDDEGLVVEELERRLAQTARPRLVYLTPHHQFPTMVALSPRRRLDLLALARRRSLCVLEDDYDNEVHYAGLPLLPLAAVDAAGAVLYVGTLSKVLAPGLRLGFVVAPAPVIDRLAAHRQLIDRQGDSALELAVAELIEDGELERHNRRVRKAYLARRRALVEACAAKLGDAVSFSLPPGGMAVWARVKAGLDVERWAAAALEAGVAMTPGSRLRHPSARRAPGAFLRLGFAAHRPAELEEALSLLAGCRPPLRRGRGP